MAAIPADRSSAGSNWSVEMNPASTARSQSPRRSNDNFDRMAHVDRWDPTCRDTQRALQDPGIARSRWKAPTGTTERATTARGGRSRVSRSRRFRSRRRLAPPRRSPPSSPRSGSRDGTTRARTAGSGTAAIAPDPARRRVPDRERSRASLPRDRAPRVAIPARTTPRRDSPGHRRRPAPALPIRAVHLPVRHVQATAAEAGRTSVCPRKVVEVDINHAEPAARSRGSNRR